MAELCDFPSVLNKQILPSCLLAADLEEETRIQGAEECQAATLECKHGKNAGRVTSGGFFAQADSCEIFGWLPAHATHSQLINHSTTCQFLTNRMQSLRGSQSYSCPRELHATLKSHTKSEKKWPYKAKHQIERSNPTGFRNSECVNAETRIAGTLDTLRCFQHRKEILSEKKFDCVRGGDGSRCGCVEYRGGGG